MGTEGQLQSGQSLIAQAQKQASTQEHLFCLFCFLLSFRGGIWHRKPFRRSDRIQHHPHESDCLCFLSLAAGVRIQRILNGYRGIIEISGKNRGLEGNGKDVRREAKARSKVIGGPGPLEPSGRVLNPGGACYNQFQLVLSCMGSQVIQSAPT